MLLESENYIINESNPEVILDFIKTNNLSSDCTYHICQNKDIIHHHLFFECMIDLFTFFYEKGELENAVYSWLDAWDDCWSSSPEQLNVRILGSDVTRSYADEAFRLKIKNILLGMLPYFGETEVYSYYKDLIQKEFNIVSY
jgi:hypothetical protein